MWGGEDEEGEWMLRVRKSSEERKAAEGGGKANETSRVLKMGFASRRCIISGAREFEETDIQP